MNNIFNSQLFQKFWQIVGAVSVRVKVMGIVLSMIVLLGVIVTVQMRSILADTLERRLLDQGLALANQFADGVAPLIQSSDFAQARSYLTIRQAHYSSAGHNTLIIYISVTGAEQQVSTWDEQAPPPSTAYSIVDIEALIPDTDAILHLGVADITVDQTAREVTVQLLISTLVMIAFGFVAAYLLTWVLTRPIYELVTATQAVAKGDFSQRVDQWADDEIGELAVAFNTMTEALAQAEIQRQERDELRSQYVSGVITAQEEERKRIARELHDSTGQSLTSLLVGLRNLQDVDDIERIPEGINELRHIVSQTLDEVRQMAWQLRPAMLDDLGLISALQRYIDDYQQRFNIQVDFVSMDIDMRLPMELETIIYRVIQEALTNVARHSQAETASVIIDRRNQLIRVIVEDDGIGFSPENIRERKSLGLQGIRERVALFEGKLTIETEIGQGTSLFIEIPCDNPHTVEQ